jgi:hypothetical protein
MIHSSTGPFQHPVFTRRTALQTGAIGLLGLGIDHPAGLVRYETRRDRLGANGFTHLASTGHVIEEVLR